MRLLLVVLVLVGVASPCAALDTVEADQRAQAVVVAFLDGCRRSRPDAVAPEAVAGYREIMALRQQLLGDPERFDAALFRIHRALFTGGDKWRLLLLAIAAEAAKPAVP